MMREHIEPTARIHYFIKDGGIAPNIVPELASVVLNYRELDRGRVEKGVAWLVDMAKGAALATQTEALVVEYCGYYDLLPNTPLAERMYKHLEQVGLPTYDEEELDFARNLQKETGLNQTGIVSSVLPVPNEPAMGGSTHVGDVSWITPTMGLVFSGSPEGVGLHTWMATASHGSSIGTKAAVAAAKVLALTGIDILTDPEFRKQVKADFDRRTEGFVYKSPLPEILKEPVGLPVEMRKYESVLELKESFYKSAADDEFYKKSVD